MPTAKTTSFTSDYGVEQAAIERQRRLAEALAQQADQPLQTNQMAGGYVIPTSPFAGLAQALNQGVAGYKQRDADTRERALAERMKGDRTADYSTLARALSGTPERAAIAAPADEFGGGPGAPAQAAVAPQTLTTLDPSQFKTPAMQDMIAQQRIAQLAKGQKWEKAELRQPDGSVKRGYVDMNSPNPEATFRGLGTEPVKQEFISGQPVNPYTQKGAVSDPNALMSPGPDGKPVLNQPLFNAKKEIAAKGAANVQVKTDVKTGESLAAQVGPMMKDSVSIAEGAVKQVDAAQRIAAAVDAGKIITGPTADARLLIAQIGQALGVGGKDDVEKIANTRQALRGLAELTLQGRQQMKGQGAITESEGKLAEKAMSGEINFTSAEIKQLAKASERAARFNYNEHARKLKVMQDNKDLQHVAPFYQGPAMPAEAGAAPTLTDPAAQRYLDQYAPVEPRR